jgi:hypothetical protein
MDLRRDAGTRPAQRDTGSKEHNGQPYSLSGCGNTRYPEADGSLLMVSFKSKDEARGIYSMAPGAEPKTLAEGLGRMDGIYQMKDGTLLVTDWNSGSFGAWSAKAGLQPLASGFKGSADFGVAPNADGLLVVVPDLVKSELRLIQLGQ